MPVARSYRSSLEVDGTRRWRGAILTGFLKKLLELLLQHLALGAFGREGLLELRLTPVRLGLEGTQGLLQIHARRRFRRLFMMHHGFPHRVDGQARLAAWTDHIKR